MPRRIILNQEDVISNEVVEKVELSAVNGSEKTVSKPRKSSPKKVIAQVEVIPQDETETLYNFYDETETVINLKKPVLDAEVIDTTSTTTGFSDAETVIENTPPVDGFTRPEIFSYEVKSYAKMPLFLTALIASIVLNFVGFAAVVFFPKIAEGLYLAELIYGASGKKGVEKDYNKDIDLSDVIFVDPIATNFGDNFQYPGGYFMTEEEKAAALARIEAEEIAAINNMNGSGGSTGANGGNTQFPNQFPNQNPQVNQQNNGGSPSTLPPLNLNQLQKNTPKGSGDGNSMVDGGLPNSPVGGQSNPKSNPSKTNRKPNEGKLTPTVPNNTSGSPTKLPTLGSKKKVDESQNMPGKTKRPVDSNIDPERANSDEVNYTPLRDLASEMTEMQKNGKLDLNKSFVIQIKGEFSNNYRIIPKQVGLNPQTQDMKTIVESIIVAINESNVLSYLEGLRKYVPKNKNLQMDFTMGQDVEKGQVAVQIISEVADEDTARKLKGGLVLARELAMKKRAEKDEGIVLSNTDIIQEGKKVIINVAMPRDLAITMIQNKIGTDQQKAGNKTNSVLTDKKSDDGK